MSGKQLQTAFAAYREAAAAIERIALTGTEAELSAAMDKQGAAVWAVIRAEVDGLPDIKRLAAFVTMLDLTEKEVGTNRDGRRLSASLKLTSAVLSFVR